MGLPFDGDGELAEKVKIASENKIITQLGQSSAMKFPTKLRRCRTYPLGSELIKRGIFSQDRAQGRLAVFFGHHGLEIGRRAVLRFALMGSPFHKEAVAQAPKHTHDPDAIGALNTASIIVVRDVQPLMRAVFNPPGKSIELEPLWSRQSIRLRTGHQGNQFLFATFGLP